MARRVAIAVAAVTLLASAASAQYPWVPRRNDPFASHRPAPPPWGGMPGSPTAADRRNRRDEDDRRQERSMVPEGLRAMPHVIHWPTQAHATTYRPSVKPSRSMSRGWFSGIGAGIAALFAALFGSRKKGG
jgi:hypothetical protein